VQRGRNNPPVKKGSKAYCKSFLSFCLGASLLLPSCTSVGEKLKQRRQSLNLTQQQVADKLGVTVTTVKNWEAARHIPKLYLEQTKALCDLLKLSLDELVD
jgi:DNA-binding XRE family transcriptional regulator